MQGRAATMLKPSTNDSRILSNKSSTSTSRPNFRRQHLSKEPLRDGSGRRFRPLIGGKAISAVALLGHNAGPHKPFVSKFVCAQLQESCIPPISPNNLAGADLCIKILGVEFSCYPPAHLQPQHVLEGQIWVPSASSSYCRAHYQFFAAVIPLTASHRRGFR